MDRNKEERQKGSELNMDISEWVQLNVSGVTQNFKVLKSLLTKDEDSMLAKQFSGRFPISKNDKDEYMITRNPKPFLAVLNFLRNDKPLTVYSQDDQEIQELKEELDYLCISTRPGT